MKSKLAIFITLSGWLLFIAYIFYESREYSSELINHFFDTDDISKIIFHIFILTVPIGSSITGYLINERKKFLEKTQLSEKKISLIMQEWKTTIDSMPYGIMLVDREFNIIRANKYIANISGIPIKELHFKKCYEVVHKTDKPVDGCPLIKSIEIQSNASLEYFDPYYNKSFLTSVTPIFDDKGAVFAYAHSLIDVTDTKEKEERLSQTKDAFFNMLKDLNSTYNEMKNLYQDLVLSYSMAIDAKSPWTKGHSEGVTHCALSIAKEIGIKSEDLEVLQTAALLHDVGKIGTYDVLLDKPGKLTAEEFKLVMKHPAKGVEILAPIKGLKNILPIIRSHHEKFDGTGYPDGLKGEEIPFFARILCIADSYDSMTANRPYRPSPGKDYAISELKRCSGTQFDPQVVEAFLKVLEREG